MEQMQQQEQSVKNEVMDIIFDKARKSDTIIALTDTEDPRIEKVVKLAEQEGLPAPLLITPDYFQTLTAEKQNELVAALQEARAARNKPMAADGARTLLSTDTKYLAATLTHIGDIDGYVAGNISTTPDAIRPALQVIGTTEGYASSFFIMCFPDGSTLFFADCGFNYDPNAQELAKIGVMTARNVQRLGIEPRVAFLSFSTAGSSDHAHVDKVREAIGIAKQMAPDLKISDHELQLDAALDQGVAARKVGESEVAGKANVLIFPDLDSGNMTYKMAARMGALAVGPIMQGLKKSANDVSRASKPEEIVATLAVTQFQADAQQSNREN